MSPDDPVYPLRQRAKRRALRRYIAKHLLAVLIAGAVAGIAIAALQKQRCTRLAPGCEPVEHYRRSSHA